MPESTNPDVFTQEDMDFLKEEAERRNAIRHAQEIVWVYIRQEREYQNEKHGTIVENPHDVPGWLLIMKVELEEAERAWVENGGDQYALCEILQVIATGVACLEQHGVVDRRMLERME